MEIVVFPNAEAVVASALRDDLGVRVENTVPNPRPSEFVRVLRTGGPRATIVTDAAQLTVESWSSTDENAHDLAQVVRAHIHALLGQTVDGVFVARIDEISGPANLPDPLSDHHRYSQSFAVHLRGATQGEGS